MIEFNCVCKQYKFSLAPEMAGSLIQCPTCRRLVDVPTLHELALMDEDGGYKFEGESTSKKLDAKVAARAFTRQRVDEAGREIDLRNSFEEIQRAGVTHAPGTLDGVRPVPPKYDPVTGELIRALPIKDEAPKRVLPIHAESEEPLDAVPIPPPKLSYAVVPPANMSLGFVFISLFQPVNLVVMGFILLMHLLLQISALVTLLFPFCFLAPLVLFMALVGHYGNVLDEIGPSGRDELPTPLRNVSFGEDIWRPFTQIALAIFLAFLPALICRDVTMPPGLAQLVMMICLAAGALAAPALVLTTVTSGTYLNLRPDRIVGVIATCAARYWLTCLTFAAALVTYWLALGIMNAGVLAFFRSKGFSAAASISGTGYAVLAGAIYLMHGFCWQLGLIYRTYHERFPWVLQRHIPVRMAERTRPTRPHSGHLPPIKR